MREQEVITKREMGFFDYQFGRVACDQGVMKYLQFLDGVYEQNGLKRKPFSAF